MSEHSKRFAQMHPDEDFEHEGSDWIHDFEVLSVENGATYGICYPESRTCRTYLAKHESTVDIINTTARHEPIHAILADFYFYGDGDEGVEMMDLEQEHKLIQKISWVEDEGVFDTDYTSLYRGQHIRPKIPQKVYDKLMRQYNKDSQEITECYTLSPKEWKEIEQDWDINKYLD